MNQRHNKPLLLLLLQRAKGKSKINIDSANYAPCTHIYNLFFIQGGIESDRASFPVGGRRHSRLDTNGCGDATHPNAEISRKGEI